MALEIKNLRVEVEHREIIKDISLAFEAGKVHALIGPNGSGKSTLAHALMGHPQCKIISGSIVLDGKDITQEKPHLRARQGLFLSFQYPATVAGVTVSNFLRTAVNGLREARGEKPYGVIDFHALLKEKMAQLKIDASFAGRSLNEGFSGGEKKRLEILQLLMLEPKYAILDEPDSGTDVDAIKIVAEGINYLKKKISLGIIVITHYNKFLEFLEPDIVNVLINGKIVASGDRGLAKMIEKNGFEKIEKS
ncbi:Fe-S cluster assembly ATPase SufC [Candidatus Woesearchaeota archaeon]|nr:Fe-S cluster assembly ATPase SufC [Candidatus Woesearchaeota archaeon]